MHYKTNVYPLPLAFYDIPCYRIEKENTMENSFFYPSHTGKHQIHAMEWRPEGHVIGVLQICHGMVEYIARYRAIGAFLAQKGYVVVGNDHLGHGLSAQNHDDLGFFHEENGNAHILADIHALRERTQTLYPDVPYFILGHSMGSFLVRQYIQKHAQRLSGVIIMGTGYQPRILLYAGRLLTRIIAAFKGWRYRSVLVDTMAFGSYNKAFQPERTSKDWLTRDKQEVDMYIANPLSSFMFTLNAYYNMFTSILYASNAKYMASIPKHLPLLFVSGSKDPVGNFGKGVGKVYNAYQQIGMEDISFHLYDQYRHELLNEVNREHVYQDIYEWMQTKTTNLAGTTL